MNYLPLLIAALGFLFFKGNSQQTNQVNSGPDLSKIGSLIANQDALNAMASINKLMDNKENNTTNVIFELLSNPFVMNLLSVLNASPNINTQNNTTENNAPMDEFRQYQQQMKNNAESTNAQKEYAEESKATENKNTNENNEDAEEIYNEIRTKLFDALSA